MKTYLFAAALLSCSALLPTQKAATAEDATTSAGKWETLFDGSNLDAWREYNRESVTTGWKIDGDALTCISRKDQGEGARGENLITKEKFAAFELELDFKVTPAANSGVMFHVVETKKPPYYTGPEIQIQDHKGGHDPQKCGWLYQLYPAETDSTKPAGEWNHLRVLITPAKCQIEVNGVLYSEFVKGSDDWNERVAKSKFGKWEGFGEPTNGHICLQDHNDEVSYRNIRVRRL
ncbi:3-keto-disaccharide hydrolase [Rhodopirellula bahusiensis]|uniref:3-keto-disaccharide hydrolase n=3 Tax=Rhodopirellula bahusiensis TaxID=2014065 RepID=UPI00326726A9